MNRFVWILVASSVGIATGLFYSLAIGASELFRLLAVLLVALAVLQWLVLVNSRRGDRLREADAEPISPLRDRS